MNKLILFFLILALIPSAAIFSAGGVQQGGQEGPVTITAWMGAWWNDQAQVVEEAYAKEHKDILNIETYPFDGYPQKVMTAIAGGIPPDVIAVEASMSGTLVTRNLLQPFEGVSISDFSSFMWQCGSYQGKQYGIPYRADTVGIFYNKDFFDKAGVAYPKDDWSWDDFVKTAKALTVQGQQYGFGVSASAAAATDVMDQILPLLWSRNIDVFKDGRCVLDDPKAVEALKFWVDLVRVEKISPEGSVNYDTKDYLEMFLSQRLGMLMSGSNLVPTLKDQAKFNWDFVAMPGGSPTRGSGYNWGIPIGAKNAKQAREFIDWFVAPDNLARLTIRLPARASATTSAPWNEPVYKKIILATSKARLEPQVAEWTEIQALIIRELQRALTGEVSTETAAKSITASANNILKVK
jgi:multiple sugar transport system substrate-binding protein